jgi:hypothetical protein
MATTHRALERRLIALPAALACGSVLLWAATKGPDAGGYTGTDEAVYSFVDISGSSGGSSLLAGTDDGTAVLTLPFPVAFYAQSYTLACVSTNGAMYLVRSVGDCSGYEGDFANTDLTAAPVPKDGPALLPFWSDLTFQVPGAGSVLYQTMGSAPARRFIVQWHDAYPQGSANPVTFQVVLTERSPAILFQYKAVDLGAANPARSGAQATVGIRNTAAETTNHQIQWSHRAPVVHDRTALLFAPLDAAPPSVTAVVTPGVLWPPNGKVLQVVLSGTASDDKGLSGARFAVTDEYGLVQPSGAITVSADGTFRTTLSLVAGRHDDDKDGRKYTIVVVATDTAGKESTASAIVIVPHDQRK